VARAGLVDAPEKAWETSWQVNVMAHVRASKALMPQWVSQGHGMFISTVSAAGLLSIPGAAPYAVTKHAAFAYAEWLSMTYADSGVRVHAVCPQGVRTRMLEDSGEAGTEAPGPRISLREMTSVVLANNPAIKSNAAMFQSMAVVTVFVTWLFTSVLPIALLIVFTWPRVRDAFETPKP